MNVPVRPLARLLLTATVGFAVAAAAAGCSTTEASSTGSKGYVAGDGTIQVFDPDQRKPAPDLSGPAVGPGEVSLADHAGQVVVLNVWGSWCAPCRAEADDLVSAARRLQDTAFLGINTRDEEPLAEAFVRRYDVPYPSIFDPAGKTLLGFYGLVNPAAIPSTLVIDDQGRIAALVTGEVTTATLVGLVEDVQAAT
jgi:peroxiredoxin